MKMIKKSTARKILKALNTIVVLMMVLQPVSAPSVLRAMAADDPSTETVSTPAPAPKEEPKTDSVVPKDTPAPDPAPASVAEPKVEPAPVVKEAAPVVEPAPAIVEPVVEPVVEPTPIVETPPTPGVITPEAASTEVVIEPVTEVVPVETVAAEVPVVTPEWQVSADGKIEKIGSVELGKTYVAPQNSEVTVTFTTLPKIPGTLSIEEIALTPEQVASLNALSNKAYDITSDMADGTFAYDLTLPKPADQENVEIKFAENVAGLENADSVPSGDVDVNNSNVSASLDHFTIFVVTVVVLQPNYAAPGGGGVYSAYYGPPSHSAVSPGSTSVYDGREAGIIKAGQGTNPGSSDWDEGLFAFKPTVTINQFAAGTVTYDVESQSGVNPVWMTIEIDTGVVGNRDDNATYQFVPTSNPTGWHTVNAAAGQWQKWNNGAGDTTGNPLISLSAIAAAHPGLNVVRAYLRLGMGDSYYNGGTGTIAWVATATFGGDTYDFSTTSVTTKDATNVTSNDATLNGFNKSAATGHSFWVSLAPFVTTSSTIPSGVYSSPDLGSIAANTDFSISLVSLTTTGVPTNLPEVTPNTKYYFAAWSLVGGTWYPGEILTFTTLAPSLIPAVRLPMLGTLTGVTLTSTLGHVAIFNGLPPTVTSASNPALFAKLEAQHPGLGSIDVNRYVGFMINPPVIAGYEWKSDSLKETTPDNVFDFGPEDRCDTCGTGTHADGTELWETVAVKSGDVYNRTFRTPKNYEITWILQKTGSPDVAVTESFTVEQTIDTTAPSVPVLTLPINEAITSNNALLMQWDDSTDTGGSGVAGYEYQVYYNCGDPSNIPGSCSGPYKPSLLVNSEYQAGATNDGTYYWQVRAKDNAENFSGWSELEKVTIDTTLPAKPTGLKFQSQDRTQDFACGAHVPLQVAIPDWNGITGDPTFSHYEYTSFQPNGSIGLNEQVLTVSELNNSWMPPADGAYGYAVRSVDLAGNKSDWALSAKTLDGSCQIIYDSIQPTVDLVFPTPSPSAISFQAVFNENVKQSEAQDPANYFLNNWPGTGGSGNLVGDATIVYDSLTKTATVSFTNPAWYISPEQQWGGTRYS